jgi:large subunit ribosomal protein L29
MRAEEIRELSDDEVRSRVAELEEERFRLRFRAATETLEDPLRLRLIRKDVARMKTILREREREAAGTTGGGARKSAAQRATAGRKTAARKAKAAATRTTKRATKSSAKRTTKGKRAAGAGER